MFRIVFLAVMSGVCLQAEDFTLKFLGDGPIALHTTLTFDGTGERLIATAKNESGSLIQKAQICVAVASVKKGCLFEVWNTEVWAPGAELSWNVTTAVKVPGLSHQAMIEEYESVKVPPSTSAAAVAGATNLSVRQASTSTPTQETLTNETLIKLTQARVSDDVILDMVNNRPGRFVSSSDAIIALKEAGVSDKVIAAVTTKGTETDSSHPSSSAPAVLDVRIENNSRLYIAPMTSNLNEFIGAEIIKQHLPLRVVLEEKDADYIMTGLSQATAVKWYDVVSGSIVGGKDRLEASAKLVRVRDKTFVWAGESGDRSLIFGAFKRGGERKLAERIVEQMKHDLF